MRYIDLRSDTVTQPTQRMREAMLTAEVGDDVYNDDPTIAKLEALAAKRLGKEAAVFVPTGTMGNQIAIMAHTSRGDEIIVGRKSHINVYEVGGAAVLSGCQVYPIDSEDDILHADLVKAAIRDDSNIHFPHTGLICLENALATGAVVPLEEMQKTYALAKGKGIPVHLDGARVFNAAVSLGVDVTEITACCDSVMSCLSKGLCAPVGSILAGSKEFVAKARKIRKLFGGGMRQAGFLAAAGIIALEEMTDRLAEDHENAKWLVKELCTIPGVSHAAKSTDINMAFVHFERPLELMEKFPARMLEKGIKIGMRDPYTARFVTNHDVSRSDLAYVVASIKEIIG